MSAGVDARPGGRRSRRSAGGPHLAAPVARAGGAGATGPANVIAAATEIYLSGEPLDMSALAGRLAIGRATLYRWVGNREELLGVVLADAAERTWNAARHAVHTELAAGPPVSGAEYIFRVIRWYMTKVITTRPLRTLTEREPLLVIRLTTMPGAVEERAIAMVTRSLQEQVDAGRLDLPLPAPVLAETITRIFYTLLHASVLGNPDQQLAGTLALIARMLGLPREPAAGPVRG